MSIDEAVVDTRKAFGSIDEIVESLTGKHIKGVTGSGSKFFGKLEGFDDQWLFLRGNHDQPIVVRRKKVESLMEAI